MPSYYLESPHKNIAHLNFPFPFLIYCSVPRFNFVPLPFSRFFIFACTPRNGAMNMYATITFSFFLRPWAIRLSSSLPRHPFSLLVRVGLPRSAVSFPRHSASLLASYSPKTYYALETMDFATAYALFQTVHFAGTLETAWKHVLHIVTFADCS